MTSEQIYEQPLVSVDVVPLWIEGDGDLNVTLGRRLNEPFQGDLALPGVLMGRERSIDAAGRALRTKVGIDPAAATLRDAGVFDALERDPRGPTMAISKLAVGSQRDLAAGDLAEAHPIHDLPELPFDHAAIIRAAVSVLGQLLWTDPDVARALLGPEFTTRTATAVQSRLEQAAGQPPRADASNMKRRLLALGWCTPTERTALPEGATGRPSTVWTWV